MNPPRSFDALQFSHASASVQVALNTVIPTGNLAARSAGGDAVLAADAAGLTLCGVAAGPAGKPPGAAWPDTVDTTGDAAGVRQSVAVQGGIFRFANSGTSPVVSGDLGKRVYVEDERTVAHATAHSVAAGVAVGLEGTAHVWLWIAAPGAFPGATNIGGV